MAMMMFILSAAIRKATAARIQGGRVVLQDLTMTPEQIRAIGRIYICLLYTSRCV